MAEPVSFKLSLTDGDLAKLKEALGSITTPPVEPGPNTYTVVAGDSLYSIARKTNVAFSTLLSLNGLTAQSVIHPGQVLKLA